MNRTVKPSLKKRILSSGWWKLLGMVLLGGGVLVGLSITRKAPKQKPPEERGKAVRTVTVAPYDVVPRAVGYGVVKARQEWQMAAQVSGRVIELHPLMKVGAIIPAETVLLKIDPEDYKLAANRQTAGVESARAQLAQLNVQETNTKATLALEKRAEELVRRDLERTRRLYVSGNTTQAEVDAAERALLTQEKAVQSLKNTLSEIPTQRALLTAQIKDSQAGLRGAKLDIDRTALVAPFDLRVRTLNVQDREVVTANQVLAEADAIDAVEITAQLAIGAVRPLVPFNPEVRDQPVAAVAMKNLPEVTGITAVVRLKSDGMVTSRQAALDRFTTVDPTTRTMGIVVVVKDPYRPSNPGEGPMIPGMYVEVELRGAVRKGCMAVPRRALHGETVYVVDKESRLELRTVEVEMRQAEYVCVKSGLKKGETVVVSEVTPAIGGMLPTPKHDEEAVARLKAVGAGEASPL